MDGLFIWIPKTAGTSIQSALNCYKKTNPPFVFENRGHATFGHVRILALVPRVISQEYFDRAFKFCFVRNPFDRLVSLFSWYHRKQGKADSRTAFEKLCRSLYEVPPIGKYNVVGTSQCNPQVDWITDEEGQVFVDFVGKFENLSRDFTYVCRRLDVNAELPHLNATRHGDYREHYTAETKAIVESIYQRDLEMFGYEF